MEKKLVLKDPEFVHEVVGLVDDLVSAGADEDKALDAVANFVDTVLPFDVFVPGAAGDALEAADGPVIRKGLEELVAFLKKLFQADPEKKAARQAARAKKRAARSRKKSK